MSDTLFILLLGKRMCLIYSKSLNFKKYIHNYLGKISIIKCDDMKCEEVFVNNSTFMKQMTIIIISFVFIDYKEVPHKLYNYGDGFLQCFSVECKTHIDNTPVI